MTAAIPGAVGSYFVGRDGAEYRKTASVRALRMPTAFRVATEEGLMSGEPGDYLCQGPAGECWPIKAAIFEATYEQVVDDA